jgi:hypothetical protein
MMPRLTALESARVRLCRIHIKGVKYQKPLLTGKKD